MTQTPQWNTDAPVRLDVFSDIACPWCFIGLRNLETAIAAEQAAGRTVVTRHRPFELQPNMPLEGVDTGAFFEDRFGGAHVMQAAFDRVEVAGRDVGLAIDHSSMPKVANTRFAHAVALTYDDDERQRAVLHALFSAYFEQGLDITDRTLVLGLAAAASGEARADLSARLVSGADVELALAYGRELGVTAVPTVVADASASMSSADFGPSQVAVAIQGAQPSANLIDLMQEARQRAGA